MSFDEKIAALIQRLPKLVDHLDTEEATKNALIMPFISALGYDVFNPQEVVPEFVADVGTKKGEKVDYTIMRDGEVIMLIECKKSGADLQAANISQLFRYFSVTHARIAILTNGTQYLFFSDLEEPNKMDSRPFLELNLADARPSVLKEVRKLGKEFFDLDEVLSSANELKYTSEIKKIFESQVENPDEELVRFFFQKANPGARFAGAAKEQFAPLVPKAFSQFVSEKVSNRLRSALQSEDQTSQTGGFEDSAARDDMPDEETKDGIITTEEELEGYRIVLAIACKLVDPSRVVYRDTKSYMGILLDDNNRKPICRLRFNFKQKYLGVFDPAKNETKIAIDSPVSIYDHANALLAAINNYEGDE